MAIKLSTPKIPDAFIKNLPEGLKVLSKKGQSFVVVDALFCSKGHSLLSENVRLHGERSIAFKVKAGGAEGMVYLDPFWGLHQKLFDFMFADCGNPPVIQAFCPECGVSLMQKKKCEVKACCGDESIIFHLPGSDTIEACAQWGCPEHNLKASCMPSDVAAAVKKINYPELHSHIEVIGF